MQDAADHPPIVGPFLAAHIGRQMRLDLLPLIVIKPEQVRSHRLRSIWNQRIDNRLCAQQIY